jgi:16S rRNA (guanine527-N7)-methyltransferase
VVADSPHRGPLEALNLAEPAVARLTAYLDAVAAWSRRVNLTGARTPEERAERLVGDVLPIVALPGAGTLLDVGSGNGSPGLVLALLRDEGTLLDVGSGNGSPGLVLALLRDDLAVTLLEPRARRWAFLREAVRTSGGPRVDVRRERHDTYSGAPARTVTVRALALPLGELAPLVTPGGRLVILGRRPPLEGPFEAEAPGRAGVHVFRRLGAVSRET